MKVVQFRGVRDRIRKDEEYRRRLSGYITNNANYLRASGYWWSKYVRYAFLLDRALSNAEVAGDKAVGPSSDTEDIASDDPEKKVILKKRKRIRRDNGRFARTRLSALGALRRYHTGTASDAMDVDDGATPDEAGIAGTPAKASGSSSGSVTHAAENQSTAKSEPLGRQYTGKCCRCGTLHSLKASLGTCGDCKGIVCKDIHCTAKPCNTQKYHTRDYIHGSSSNPKPPPPIAPAR